VVREEGDFDAAVAIGRKAVECDEASAQAHNALGLTYMYMGFYEAAEAEFRRSVECDGLFLSPYLNRLEVLLYEKRPADAVAAGKEAVQVEPRSGLALFKLGSALLASGRFDEAEQRWAEAVRTAPQQFSALRDVVTALMQFERGDPAPGRAILARYRGRSEFRSVLWSSEYVDLCIRADAPEAALECLERSPHFREYRGMVTDPALARLRGDARFGALLAGRRARWESDVARYGPSLAAAPPKL